jgi:S-layer homology domain
MRNPFRSIRSTGLKATLGGLALAVAIPTAAIAAATPFTDVPGGQWFTDAVDWAYDNNITTGVSPTEFAGDQGFTRYQAVTMLERMDTNIIQPGLDAVSDDISQIYHATVAADGTLKTDVSTSGTTATRVNEGIYELDFPVAVDGCAWQATLVTVPNGGLQIGQPQPPTGEIGLARDFDGPAFTGSFDASGIYVETYDSAGVNADQSFTVSVTCSPLGGFNGPFVIVLP